MFFGSHLSIAGNLSNALREAEELSFDTVQIFTKNQRQWKPPVLKDEVVEEWRSEVKRVGWEGRTVSHASYLINLASPKDELWKKSIELMLEEIERCERLGIKYLVHHPGAYTESDLEAGIRRIAKAYKELSKRTKGYTTVMCLENTAGSGTTIGWDFDELRRLREQIGEMTGMEDRVGYCFDTCHAHAAGYDMAGREKADEVFDEFDEMCGLSHLKVVHVNDSKGAMGSRVDRHAHIGEGTIGKEGFGAVVNRAELAGIPLILETPKGETEKGTPLDTVNLRRLKRLAE